MYNSISAESQNIEILLINDENGNPMLSIEDDGVGMTQIELLQAMKLCSKDRYQTRSKNDLGRFGMGLKTASLSQCRQLTVESNMNGQSTSMTWDLDDLQKIVSYFLLIEGFSVGIGDMVADNKTYQKISIQISKKQHKTSVIN